MHNPASKRLETTLILNLFYLLRTDFRNIYDAMLADAPYDIVQPEVMIFMIVELVSSTCYSSILYNEPVDIGELKPYLYICINNIIDTHAGTVKA